MIRPSLIGCRIMISTLKKMNHRRRRASTMTDSLLFHYLRLILLYEQDSHYHKGTPWKLHQKTSDPPRLLLPLRKTRLWRGGLQRSRDLLSQGILTQESSSRPRQVCHSEKKGWDHQADLIGKDATASRTRLEVKGNAEVSHSNAERSRWCKGNNNKKLQHHRLSTQLCEDVTTEEKDSQCEGKSQTTSQVLRLYVFPQLKSMKPCSVAPAKM